MTQTTDQSSAHTANGQTGEFHVLLVGAGFAMFGTTEGPWNIAKRLEGRLGSRLVVDAIIEVDPSKAEAALAKKRDTPAHASYKSTKVFPDVDAYASAVSGGSLPIPKAICVATPPAVRGGMSEPRDLELKIIKHFPEANIFLEKPVATGAPWEKSVGEAKEVGRILREHKGIISVGYVLRYLRAVQTMKKIIEDNNLHVMATFARWIMAYPPGIKLDWWNKAILQGPVIEQGTHVCDLSRYFGGDINVETLSASAVEWYEKPGNLSQIQIDESKIPEDSRIPRFTSASWKYKSGAVGSMMHGVALQGTNDSIELQVFADGYQMILSDPYGSPELRIRSPDSDESQIISTAGDDPYQTEMNHFIDAIEGGGDPSILSSYEDAAQTYEFTWAIRLASEANSDKQKALYNEKGSA
ncbi:putative oxidoreductase C terminal-domain-containing protein [Kockovaella imperatae]|uniref:Putative oxidoreductase C terminal-domain-containing protein n=1 Tax=Kockovaella imperatae TaxID=4999 RepID=A0A1Y1UEK8_9TREE|nr:putative oxidoreductase C terminal-domain-containing protein [Kockovaella imperatae]ORX35936.1 putative oxidoreductase C terminal-domain-containing protein [Kockovaella imperatae]